MPDKIPRHAVLCYIDEPWAYFTTQPLAKQWGDDWNDAPYEENAGRPHGPRKPDESWQIYKIAFEADCCFPDEFARSLSVEDINRGEVPWVLFCGTSNDEIYAGTSFDEFCQTVIANGGTIYLPERKEETE